VQTYVSITNILRTTHLGVLQFVCGQHSVILTFIERGFAILGGRRHATTKVVDDTRNQIAEYELMITLAWLIYYILE
jgi:hypothetical protein